MSVSIIMSDACVWCGVVWCVCMYICIFVCLHVCILVQKKVYWFGMALQGSFFVAYPEHYFFHRLEHNIHQC